MGNLEQWYEQQKGKHFSEKIIEECDPHSSVLIVIDMVNGFTKHGALYHPNIESLIAPVSRTMREAKAASMPILGFGDAHEKQSVEFTIFPEHCVEGTEEAELAEELQDVGMDVWIPKRSTNGFLEELFQEWLQENKHVHTFIVTGDCTDICILQFVLSLTAYFTKQGHKKNVIVPVNLVDTFSHNEHPSHVMNTFSFYLMEQSGAELVQWKHSL
ncbi:cysteine hydrolase family protein [Alteribacillus sp. HJP-4]|uniref:cysteine hydrolase family protein n=1 Tax=Alteribacillus sp. HJP-4 TaxID=2775394 RepID=UPI0035CCDB12